MALFSPRLKTPLHIVEIVLIVAVMAITGVRLLQRTMPNTRADSMGLGVGGKSLLLIAYELLSEHVRKLHRWASHWANLIINFLDIVFWVVVIYMLILANFKICTSGPLTGNNSCIMYFGIIILSDMIALISAHMTILCVRDIIAVRRKKRSKTNFVCLENSGGELVQPLKTAASAAPTSDHDDIQLVDYPRGAPRQLQQTALRCNVEALPLQHGPLAQSCDS